MATKIISTLMAILIVLTTLNLAFLVVISVDPPLRNHFYTAIPLPSEYSEQESLHMQEVKELMHRSLLVNLALLATGVARRKDLDLTLAGTITLSLVGLLVVTGIFFKPVFHLFHLVSFDSTNWLLPSNSKLIVDYPFVYFRNTFLIITTLIAIQSLALLKIGRSRT